MLVEMGVYGEKALRYADHMRGTLWFQGRALHYAAGDLGAAVRESLIAQRLRDIVTRF